MKRGHRSIGRRLVEFNELAEQGRTAELLSLLTSDEVRGSTRLRCGVLAALGETGDPRAEQTLIALAGDENEHEDVRLFAIRGLRSAGSHTSIGVLSNLIRDPSHRIRAAAVEPLGEIGDASVAPLLVGLLEDGKWVIRERAAAAIGKLGAKQAVPALINCLEDPHRIVRVRAAQALVLVGDETALEPVAKARRKDWLFTRLLMTKALRDLRGRLSDQ